MAARSPRLSVVALEDRTVPVAGALDTSFGYGGFVVTSIGDSVDHASKVAVQPDGKILATGYAVSPGGYTDIALVRYNSDGSLDASFDSDGVVITSITVKSDYSYDLVVQPDGKIVVGGACSDGGDLDFCLVRYNPDGRWTLRSVTAE